MERSEQTQTTYLDYLARCRQAFTPFAPIELPDFFAGRAHVIDDVQTELAAPGRHVAIYGERGVGKTSLAALLYFFGNYDDDQVHVFRCSVTTTFDDICASILTEAGHSLTVTGAEAEDGKEGKIALGPVVAGSSRRSTVSFRPTQSSQAASPTRMLQVFGQVRGLLIVDEFDRVKDEPTRTRMAEMVKHFSDARSMTKIVIVGVADTLADLIGKHESLSRSLAQVGLRRMDEPELLDIIRRGTHRTGTSIDESVATKMVRLADGFPHFVHLLCLYASLYAGERIREPASGSPHIGSREYHLGLKSALAKSEHSLHETYERAVVTTRRKSDIYELTLRGMALSEERDVQVRDLARNASYLNVNPNEDPLRPEKFSNALGELIKDDRARMLTKVRDGYYKFTNPLMRPYIRFLLEFDNLTLHRGQLEFPFMKGK